MSEALAATVGVRAGVGLTVGARVGAEVGEAVGIDAAFAGQEGHESQPYNKKPRKKLTSKTSVGRLWKIVVKLIKFRESSANRVDGFPSGSTLLHSPSCKFRRRT